ncbi:MAG: flagellar hook-basal body protein [Lachnospiraceae bacterium]|nr:flagellar hook-basal body protein [Lachnospiraceae bacterium]
MVKGLYTAYTGMVQEQRRLDVLANNLANSTTVGYKREGATSKSFRDELALRIKDSERRGVRGIGDIQMGVKIGETYTDYSDGAAKVTDEQADLAIQGEGFFAIEFMDKNQNPSVKYTRNGEFNVDKDGYLVTADGDHLLNQEAAMAGSTEENGFVRVDPMLPFFVDESGAVFQNEQQIGTIGLVDFEDYDYLTKYGENLFDLEEGGEPAQAAGGKIVQGHLETANVNIAYEMVNMIQIQRAYEAGQKMIQTEDSTLEMAIGQVGSVS